MFRYREHTIGTDHVGALIVYRQLTLFTCLPWIGQHVAGVFDFACVHEGEST